MCVVVFFFFFFQAEDGIRDLVRSRGLGDVYKRQDKIIGMHFMNPVPVMKLVEVIRGYATSDETTTTIMDLSLIHI